MTHPQFDPSSHPDLTTEESELIRKVAAFTEKYFQNPKFDASHDFQHVLRVVRNAIHIFECEIDRRSSASSSSPTPNLSTVILGALLHDVGDKKYIEVSDSEAPMAKLELQRLGVTNSRAAMMQEIVDGVSYSSEVKAPERVKILIQKIPELAIVQDADRLDAIGAIGIGRCFTFGGAKSNRPLDDTLLHFDEKLFKLEGMMKTATGRKLAAERSGRLKKFVEWWREEHKL